ncbi:MAG: hypothetical protein AAFS07_12945 [Pseudomonadota bacterium]
MSKALQTPAAERAALAALLDREGAQAARQSTAVQALVARDPEAAAMLDAALAAETALAAPRRRDLTDEGAAAMVLTGLAARRQPNRPSGAAVWLSGWRGLLAGAALSGAVAVAGVMIFEAGYEQGAAEAMDLFLFAPFPDLALTTPTPTPAERLG